MVACGGVTCQKCGLSTLLKAGLHRLAMPYADAAAGDVSKPVMWLWLTWQTPNTSKIAGLQNPTSLSCTCNACIQQPPGIPFLTASIDVWRLLNRLRSPLAE